MIVSLTKCGNTNCWSNAESTLCKAKTGKPHAKHAFAKRCKLVQMKFGQPETSRTE